MSQPTERAATLEPTVDLAFPLLGKTLPLDHGYALFSALCRLDPKLHERPSWGIHPVLGLRAAPHVLALTDRSFLKLRLPAFEIKDALGLAGKTLELDGHRVRLGVPRVFPLEAKGRLRARFVTLKGFFEEPEFLQAARRHIADVVGTVMDPERVEVRLCSRANGRGDARRVMRVAGRTIVGFPVEVGGLSEEGSIALQVAGIGGRRHMGAGLFVPLGRER